MIINIRIDMDTSNPNDMDMIEDIKDLLWRLGEYHDPRSEGQEESSRTTEED